MTDIAVFAPDGTLGLVVEVKNRPGASAEWAAQTVRNMFAHGVVPEAPYFMLVLPDVAYLWDNRERSLSAYALYAEEGAKPDYEIDAVQALESYLGDTPFSPDELSELSEQGLELLVASWLHDLMNYDLWEDTVSTDLGWFIESGLFEAIKEGSLATEVVL